MEQNILLIMISKIGEELERQITVDNVFKAVFSVFSYWVITKINHIETKISSLLDDKREK